MYGYEPTGQEHQAQGCQIIFERLPGLDEDDAEDDDGQDPEDEGDYEFSSHGESVASERETGPLRMA